MHPAPLPLPIRSDPTLDPPGFRRSFARTGPSRRSPRGGGRNPGGDRPRPTPAYLGGGSPVADPRLDANAGLSRDLDDVRRRPPRLALFPPEGERSFGGDLRGNDRCGKRRPYGTMTSSAAAESFLHAPATAHHSVGFRSTVGIARRRGRHRRETCSRYRPRRTWFALRQRWPRDRRPAAGSRWPAPRRRCGRLGTARRRPR